MEYGIKLAGSWNSSVRRTAGVKRQNAAKPVRQQLIYPFRILAVVLSISILIELIAILMLPDYHDEVEKAKHDYLIAEAENIRLKAALEEAGKVGTVEESARQQGYTYYGETIYIPIIEGENDSL
ncbi:MAG: hypothetical protein IJ242_09070 [Clostridia bacterium]|nr:hypothetical protein [Clostridia bacterium]